MKHWAAFPNLLFRGVCIFFSALRLLLTLRNNVKLMAAEKLCLELERKIAQTEYENEILRVRLENRISLCELERIAVNQLGMHRPSPEQLYFDMIPG